MDCDNEFRLSDNLVNSPTRDAYARVWVGDELVSRWLKSHVPANVRNLCLVQLGKSPIGERAAAA